ncbi:MAG: NINE protein [Bacteroidetes bacterium]|nr:NINE protein [Bacteroidota bacterium]
MANIYQFLPDIDGAEFAYVSMLINPLTDEQAQQFAVMYRARRKDPQMILILTLLGFFSIAGIQRFVTGQIGFGLLYLLTGGLCFIGTIIDLVNYRKIAADHNMQQAFEVATIMRTMGVVTAPPTPSTPPTPAQAQE